MEKTSAKKQQTMLQQTTEPKYSLQKVQPTLLQALIAKKSKLEIVREFNDLSLAKVINGNYPSIGQIKREMSAEKAETLIAVLIADLSHSFDGELSQDSIEEIAAEASTGLLMNLSLEDIYLVCRDIKTSKTFGKLKVNVVLNALNKHFEKKTTAAAEHNYNRHLSYKYNDEDARMKDIEKGKDLMRKAQNRYLRENPEKLNTSSSKTKSNDQKRTTKKA